MLGLFYYSLLQIASSEWKLATSTQLIKFKILGYFLFILILLYTGLRIWTNLIAGIYMLKRVFMALMLFLNPLSEGAISLFLGLLIIELIFTGFRVCLECRIEVMKLKDFLRKRVRDLSAENKKEKPKEKETESP